MNNRILLNFFFGFCLAFNVLNLIETQQANGTLSKADIKQMYPKLKSSSTISLMNLNEKNISSILPGTFSGLKVLSLTMSKNSLTQLNPQVFANISRLDSLDLSHNKLVSLKSPIFDYMNGLAVLDVSFNNLTYLDDPLLFRSLQNLDSLNLASNRLSFITAELFSY